MKKKTIALMGFSVLAALALVGCGKNDDNNKTTTSAQGGDTTTSTTSQGGGNTTTSQGGGNTTTSQGGGNTTTSQGGGSYEQYDASTGTGAVGDFNSSSGSASDGSYTSVDVDYVADTKGLDISVNYQAKQGISFIGEKSFKNPIDGETYQGGKTAYASRVLLPTWKEFAKKVKTTIRDAEDYGSNKDDGSYANMKDTKKWKSASDTSQYVDLFYNSTKSLNDAITKGLAADLTQFINRDLMPNFKNYLEANPTIADQLTKSDGKIYYTPYFDGYQFLERQFVLNSALAFEVLDQQSFALFDTTVAGVGALENGLQGNKYEPFIYGQKSDGTKVNFLEDKQVVVSKNGAKTTITVKGDVENIISQQNKLLAAGTTGKALAEQLHQYLVDVYGDNIGADKTYKNFTEIFCGESAAYTTDEMVALMRVIRANPGVISGVFDENGQLTTAGDPSTEVQIFIPRGAAANRIQNIMMISQFFGIQGTDAEDDASAGLYFDSEGTLSSMKTTKASYQALEYLHQFYEEGLIVKEFWTYSDSFKDGNYYRDKYFGHNKNGGGYGFIMYDYSATQGQANQIDSNGIGVAADQVLKDFKENPTGRTFGDYQVGIMPILPPLTYWATSGEAYDNLTADITSRENKTLMRYSDSNRSLKTNSWIIPASSDNKDKAAQLMDYMFNSEGADIQDFGPSAYWGEDITYKGKVDRGLSAETLSMLAQGAAGDCFSFWRGYIGSSHGIGHVRSDHLNYIFMHEITRIGDKNLANALTAGVLKLALVEDNPSWGSCVPSTGYKATSSTDETFDAVTSFWSQDKNKSSADGWAKVVAEGVPTDANTQMGYGTITKTAPYTYADLMAQYKSTYIKACLATILDVTQPDLDQYLPEYVLNLA